MTSIAYRHVLCLASALLTGCGSGNGTGLGSSSYIAAVVNQQTVDTIYIWPPNIGAVPRIPVLPRQTHCMSIAASDIAYPHGLNGIALAGATIQKGLSLFGAGWGVNTYPDVTITYGGDREWTWSVGAAPCGHALSLPPLSSALTRFYLTSAVGSTPDSCVINTAYKTTPDTLGTSALLDNQDIVNVSPLTYGPVTIDVESFRDSVSASGLKAHIINPGDTLGLTEYVSYPSADSEFVSWNNLLEVVCGQTFP